MRYEFVPQNVCSRKITVDVDGDVIKNVRFEGGCPGNTVGLCNMIEGMNIKDVIKKLKGIPCKGKNTSCPDQLAKALEKIIEN